MLVKVLGGMRKVMYAVINSLCILDFYTPFNVLF